MIDVMLVAPVRAYRDALAAAIDTDADLRIVAHAASGAEALARLAPRIPGVTLLDFGMDHVQPVLAALRQTTPATRLLAIAVPITESHTEAVIRAAETGVAGFIDADQPLTDIVDAIHLIVRGQSPCSPSIAATLLHALRRRPGLGHPAGPLRDLAGTTDRSPSAGRALTPRELTVAQLVARGMTNRQIAGELVVGEATVKTHVHAVLRKLGVGRREDVSLADIPELRGPWGDQLADDAWQHGG